MSSEEAARQIIGGGDYVTRSWDADKHPRAPSGAAGGGEFAPGGSGHGSDSKDAKGGKGTRPAPSNQHPVGLGERGKRVSDLQARLNALGAEPPLKLDGVYGPKTLAAVRAFQKAHGLKVDGLVGPLTTAALRERHTAPKAAHHAPVKVPAKAAKPAAPGTRGAPARRALAHEPIGKPGGPGMYGMKGQQYPAYFQHIRNDLMAGGHPESEAHQLAWGILRNFAAGHDGRGDKVGADTQAKAAAALAELEKLGAEAKAVRSASMSSASMSSDCDEDGLDASWDGDLSELPSLTGLDVGDFEDADDAGSEPARASRAARPGTGARFKALQAKLAAKGASDPGALAAYIGRKKYGKGKFTALAKTARKSKGGHAMARSSILRLCPLEDIHILRRAEGDGSGRIVEAYATVFDEPVEISDGQGHYEEIIDRCAFDATLARIQRARGGLAGAVRVLYNHGKTMEGMPAPEFQRPIGKPLEVRPDGRGLLTRTEYKKSPLADEILDDIKEGRITAQSFEGPVMRSDPGLRGPGDRYRARGGSLPRVRRMMLGLFNYGPALFAAYSGAEFLGVRMQLPGMIPDGDVPDYTEGEEYVPDMEGDGAGGTPEEVHPSRDHAHQLLAIRTSELCREAGITPRRSQW